MENKTEVKKVTVPKEYVSMRHLTQAALSKLEKVVVRLELVGQADKLFPRFTIVFSDDYSKVAQSKSVDMRTYNLVVKKRKLDSREKLHVFAVYVRYFKGLRKDESEYFRFETYICKDVTVTEFFDYRDMDIITTFDLPIKFKKNLNKKKVSLLDSIEVDDFF